MLRRFLLVGVFVTVKQGSVEQLAYGTLISIVYLAIQLIAGPYRKQSDDFFAAVCGLLLATMFVVCIFYKVSVY